MSKRPASGIILKPTDRMPYGVHAGKLMQDLPFRYLKYLYERNCPGEVRGYVDVYFPKAQAERFRFPVPKKTLKERVIKELLNLRSIMRTTADMHDGMIVDREELRSISALDTAIEIIKESNL